MKQPKVTIIITNWNGKAHLSNCLRSLSKVTYSNYEIIVVDNGSQDGSTAHVKRYFPQVRVIENKEDFGFAKGNNIGVSHAKGKYILLLNNDTLVAPHFIEPLVARAQSDLHIGVVQPKIIFAKNRLLQSGCSYLTMTGFLYYTGFSKNPNEAKYNKPGTMYSANGACMLIRHDVIKRIGLFDESYFSYFEETDFCHRVWLAGYTVRYEPKGVIYHFGGMDNSREKPLKIQFHMFRNRISSYCKNLSLPYLLTLLPVHLLVCFVYGSFSLLRGKSIAAQGITKALWWNLTQLPETLRKRTYIQQQVRKASDRDILRDIIGHPRLSYYYHLIDGLDRYID